MTKIYGTAYPIVTDAECVARGASVHHVSVAEFCTLKIVSEVVVAQAKRKFRTMVHELPSGSPITLEIMHAWAEANFRQYRWEDVVEPVAMTAPKPSIVPADALAISIPEAAGRLGIGETTRRAMIDGGILPAVRIGLPGKRGRVVVRVTDLDKLLATPASAKPKATAGKAVTP